MPQIPVVSAPAVGPSSYSVISLPSVSAARVNPDRIADPVMRAFDNVGGAVRAMHDFSEKLQHASDYDAMREAKRMAEVAYNDYLADPQRRNDPETFSSGLDEVRSRVETEVRERFPAVSSDAASAIRNNLADLYSQGVISARNLTNQHKISEMQTSGIARIHAAVDSGDIEAAHTELSNLTDRHIISPAQAVDFRDNIAKRALHNQVAAEIDRMAQPLEVSQRLQERDDKGSYKNYPGLDLNDRLHLERYARERQSKKIIAADDMLVTRYAKGELTPVDIKEAFDSGEITGKQYLHWKMVFDQSGRTADAARIKTEKNMLKLQIYDLPWSADPVRRQEQFAEQLEQVNAAKLPPDVHLEVKKALSESLQAYEKPDQSYRRNAFYELGRNRLKQIRKDGGYYSDPDGLFNKKSDDRYQDARHAEAVMAFDAFFRATPDKQTAESVNHYISTMMADLNRGAIEHLFQRRYSAAGSGGLSLREASNPGGAPSVGTVLGGYRFLGGDPKKLTSWEAVK